MRIAVVTAGGDSPGMNACIRAVVRAARGRSAEVVGIADGILGWARGSGTMGDLRILRDLDVSNLLDRRGTILGTAREVHVRHLLEADLPPGSSLPDNDELMHDEVATAVLGSMMARTLRNNEIGGVVVIGGDKSSRVAQVVYTHTGSRLPIVIVPASIDNDVRGTTQTLGFDSAVSRAVDYVDDLRETARALNRIFVVEVMGRNQGHIAVEVALATGAEEVLIPELPFDSDSAAALVSRLRASRVNGRGSAIVVVAEGVRTSLNASLGAGEAVARHLASELADLAWEVRTHIVGHVQRGAQPTATTRNLAARCGVYAADRLLDLITDGTSVGHPEMCSISRSGDLTLTPVSGDMIAEPDKSLLQTIELCRRLSYFGDTR